jgi:hypothetical protein
MLTTEATLRVAAKKIHSLYGFPFDLSNMTRSAARRCGQFTQLAIRPLVAWIRFGKL